jgi:para-nitrobenzyl esterase
MKRHFLIPLLGVSILLSTTAFAAIADPVRVEQGLLAGLNGSSADIRVYRGVPFAAPPVGDLRWKAPQPAAKWQGVRKAAEFSNACWQTPYPLLPSIKPCFRA